MRILAISSLLALLSSAVLFTACETAEPVPVPGTLTVNWTHGDVATCGIRDIETLHVSITHPSDETLSNSQEVACPENDSNGQVLFEGVMPSTYSVSVDGILEDGQIYYNGTGSVTVDDGADAVSTPIKLEKRKSSLHVEWSVWGQCHKIEGGDGVTHISVDLYELDDADEVWVSDSGLCEAEFVDPVTEETGYGLIFEELDPVEVIVVVKAVGGVDADNPTTIGTVASAVDADGNEIELINGNVSLKLNPGTNHKIVVELVAVTEGD